MKFDTNYYELKNGVRVLTVPMKSVESVATLVLVKTGSRNEKQTQAGISHVLEHMVLKGTSKYPKALDLAEAVDEMGAEFNAFTGKEYTGYYIKSASNHLRKSLEVLAEMLHKPKLRQGDLDREKGVIIEEINMYEDLPMERAGEEFENLMFQGSDLGRLIIGEKKTVKSLSSGDLRAYINRWYRGGNVLVVVVGKLPKDLNLLVSEFFGGMGDGGVDEYESTGKLGDKKREILKKDTEQAHFVLGFPGLKFSDERRYALNLLRIVLGGNMSSRLFTEIREKRGWAYYVSAMKQEYADVGYVGVRAGVKLGVLRDAIAVVKKELLGAARSVKAEEVAKAKEYFKGKFVLSLEDPLGVARFMSETALLLGEIRDPVKMMQMVERIELDEVRGIAKELLVDEKMRLVVVGPYSDEMKLEKKNK